VIASEISFFNDPRADVMHSAILPGQLHLVHRAEE
jgi:hypothetical protein